jgi:hypothetical protein
MGIGSVGGPTGMARKLGLGRVKQMTPMCWKQFLSWILAFKRSVVTTSKGIRPVFLSIDMVNYWLMKSELDVYPYSQLVQDGLTHWDGVRELTKLVT